MKNKLNEISATPSKRIYLSIIADYHLNLALCELIDNAIDNWIFNGRVEELHIDIDLDYEQQSITVKDNSGGIQEQDLPLIVGPGQSRDNPSKEIIGVFGVGSKRAVVALSKNIKIYSRHGDSKTLMIEIDDDWIEDEDNWDLPVYEVSEIEENTTEIKLNVLREQIQEGKHKDLFEHLSTTYAHFLIEGGLILRLNNIEITPKTFDNWSYPPEYEPMKSEGPIKFKDRKEIKVSITGGLTKSHKEGDSDINEYGVYFYCNNRLISRAYKGDEIGFNSPFKIGKPHVSYSLVRVIVELSGPVNLMPWNSSKSSIDFKHKTFLEISEHIQRVFTTYATMSKNWSGDWPNQVFKYSVGDVKRELLADISGSARIHVPIIKRSPKKVKYIDQIKKNNKEIAIAKPWTKGHYESIIAVEEISKLKIEQSNRIAMLLLDSTLEIAFKDYLVNDSGEAYSANRLADIMKNRAKVHTEVKKHTKFKSGTWDKVKYFYNLRCELVHKRAAVSISDSELSNFRNLTEYILKKLFKLNFNRG
ncbi:ATP-binding protein [Aquimarina algiphila]|uniref:ATP-binding protein n=1 Tax=Aquimarina algiphila TaxID=2047982 RepID=UPI00248FEC5B|nr:ATP-binding protein [Aquimarina algiphila]